MMVFGEALSLPSGGSMKEIDLRRHSWFDTTLMLIIALVASLCATYIVCTLTL